MYKSDANGLLFFQHLFLIILVMKLEPKTRHIRKVKILHKSNNKKKHVNTKKYGLNNQLA